jgi:nucleoside-diphosphate-sugar epimerase
MHVLVAGCGWLGRALARTLLARGDRVTAVRRDAGRLEELRALGAAPLALDLADPASAARVPPGVEAIVACQAAGADGVEAYTTAYVRANETLLTVAGRLRLRGLVYTGSTGVFGQRDGSDVDERTPPAPASPAAEVLVEAERLLLGAAERGVPARIVRLSGLYGPGRAGIVDRVRSGALALGPGEDAWMNFCHLDDAVAAVIAALDRGRDGAVYHATDAHPTRRREVVEWIAARLGVDPPRAGSGDGAAAGRGGANRRILGERTRRELSLTLAFPSFREGLAPLVAAARSG